MDKLIVIGDADLEERMTQAADAFAASNGQLAPAVQSESGQAAAPSLEAIVARISGDLVVRVKGQPGARGPMHVHDCEQVLIVTNGRGYIETPAKRHELAPGSVVLVEANQPHRHGSSDGEGIETIFLTTTGYTSTVIAERD